MKDESYGPAERNRLDVYFPLEEKPGGYPVVLYVHGGGFFSGDKGWSEKVLARCNDNTYSNADPLTQVLGECGILLCAAWFCHGSRKSSTSPACRLPWRGR